MRKIHSYLCALCVGLLSAACSTEDTSDVVDNTNPNSEIKIIKVPVSVEAPFTSEAETRSMTHSNNGFALYDFDKMVTDGTDFNILLCLRNKTDGSLYYTDNLTSKLRKSGNGYKISFSNAEVNIKAGTSLSDYEVCALLNTGIDGDKFKSAFIPAEGKSSTTVDFSDLPYTDDAHSIAGMCVPMYSSYNNSHLTYDSSTGKGSITLDFYMMGTVITARVRNNPMAVPIKFSKFTFYQCNVKTGEATYTFGKETNSGEPAFTFDSSSDDSSDDCTFEWAKDAARELLPSNSTAEVVGDFWCFPVNTNGFYQNYGLYYELENGATNTYTADNFNYYKGEGETKPALSTGMESGKCYKVGFELPKSDLMITEYEHLNPNQTNYSMIEIYNPTNEVKDLREYGLVRETGLKYYRNIFSHNDDADYLKFNGTTENIDEALIQDLWISPTAPASVKNVSCQTNTNYTENSYKLLADYQGSYSSPINYSKTINGTTYSWDNLQPYELAPGQTVVLFAAGTKKLIDDGNTSSEFYPSGSHYFNSTYLTTAIEKGDCKYAIAVDNGATQNAGSGITDGGVFQAGQTHNIILMKKDGSKFKTLDAVFSLDPDDEERSYWVWNWPMNSTDENGENHRIISRRPSVMYPYTIRRVDDYFSVTLHAHAESPIPGYIWDGFDWQWIFTNAGYFNVFDDKNKTLVSPGTRNPVESYKTTN